MNDKIPPKDSKLIDAAIEIQLNCPGFAGNPFVSRQKIWDKLL